MKFKECEARPRFPVNHLKLQNNKRGKTTPGVRTKQLFDWNALKGFLLWVQERHLVHLRRRRKQDKPWTTDTILQRFFFTNPYREHDKTTAWFRRYVRQPLNVPISRSVRAERRKHIAMSLGFATIAFRWFNYIPTGKVLLHTSATPYEASLNNCLLTEWNTEKARKVLKRQQEEHGKIVTGAFMVKTPLRVNKVDGICNCLDVVWEDRYHLATALRDADTLQQVWEYLHKYPYMGDFMAYEVATDLRHTHWLEDADDVDTWCSPGPGCRRGLLRLLGQKIEASPNAKTGRTMGILKVSLPENWQALMGALLSFTREAFKYPLSVPVLGKVKFPHFEMREIEHSLCEFDKYERARLGEGSLKRKYDGE